MCRFVFYRGAPIRLSSLITEPAHSIIHQSYHSKECAEPLSGEVGGFHSIRRQIQSELSEEAFNLLAGSTDSEHLFALFANNYSQHSDNSKLEALGAALIDAITTVETRKNERGIRTVSMLNVVLMDGELTVVTRYASRSKQEPHTLYLHTGSAYECVDSVCHMRDRSESGDAVLVASEPLSHDDGWRSIPANSMFFIDKNLAVEERPINISESLSC